MKKIFVSIVLILLVSACAQKKETKKTNIIKGYSCQFQRDRTQDKSTLSGHSHSFIVYSKTLEGAKSGSERECKNELTKGSSLKNWTVNDCENANNFMCNEDENKEDLFDRALTTPAISD